MTDTTPDQPMTNADRQALDCIAKGRAKQAEREAETQEKILIVEVLDLMTAEYAARDELWSDAVAIGRRGGSQSQHPDPAAVRRAGHPTQARAAATSEPVGSQRGVR